MMARRSSLRALDRLLSRSVPGTLLVVAGGGIVAAGLCYGTWIALADLLAPSSGPTPASASGPFWLVGVTLLAGLGLVTLGGRLVGHVR
ncbi:hypothetical protein M0R89_20035 (plasmid) [Halorussus limi]|uniref:Uncharacterized protein n=1 Tax=Halorussus limi TaxID=2938695 RepID=A0A8U0I107_9EURY|nr:hypothetical protein [Halorussus limi]UPV76454.1 hypothetical protein M0R89_20035 [Halorussus limi]